jgi:Na+-translocating ferredoxin:NAD+ oxidoreductase RnfA subunit
MIDILLIFFAAIVTENMIFTHLYGVSPFIKVSSKLKYVLVFTAFMVVSGVLSVVAFRVINTLFLQKFGAEYLAFFTFAFIAAIFTQLMANALKNIKKDLYEEMHDIMVLVAVNVVIIGVALTGIEGETGLVNMVIYDLAYSLGFFVISLAFCSVMQRLSVANPPKALSGMPLTFIAIGLIIMAFYGFTDMRFGEAVSTAFLKYKI